MALSKPSARKRKARMASKNSAAKRTARLASALNSTATLSLQNLTCDEPDVSTNTVNAPHAENVNTRFRTHLSRIIFVTGNAKKLEEFKLIMGPGFHIPLKGCAIDLPELQGPSAEAVARQKLREACHALQPEPSDAVICEDTSLCFNALNGLPGPYVKWFLNSNGPEGLFKMVEGFEDHSAYAQCIFGFYGPPPSQRLPKHKHRLPSIYSFGEPTQARGCDSCKKRDYNDADRDIRLFVGQCIGNIVEPRGEHAFGWDPCFEPTLPEEEKQEEDTNLTASMQQARRKKTFAEMTSGEKNACSHRARALEKLKQFLCENYVVKKNPWHQ